MDFTIPTDIQQLLDELDQFIEDVIVPMQSEDDNDRFFDHRREDSRTDWERDGLPNAEWEALLWRMREAADEAGFLRWHLPERFGGKNGTNLGMAIVREHLTGLYDLYGDTHGVRVARKHIAWYLDALPGAEEFRRRVNRVESAREQLDSVTEFIAGSGRPDRPLQALAA